MANKKLLGGKQNKFVWDFMGEDRNKFMYFPLAILDSSVFTSKKWSSDFRHVMHKIREDNLGGSNIIVCLGKFYEIKRNQRKPMENKPMKKYLTF